MSFLEYLRLLEHPTLLLVFLRFRKKPVPLLVALGRMADVIPGPSDI